MEDYFSADAQEAIQHAHREAGLCGCARVSSGHLLLGLMALRQGAAWGALRDVGLTVQKARRSVKLISTDPTPNREPYFSPEARRVLEAAVYAADGVLASSAHLLMGILGHNQSEGVQVLKDLGVEAPHLKQALNERLELDSGEWRRPSAAAAPVAAMEPRTPSFLEARSRYGTPRGTLPPIDVPRTGIGFDVHAFAPGRKLVLGGVTVPAERGLQGHSDADVLTHAIIDALLGAAGMGDIGHHFPDTDARWRGASSLQMLAHVRKMLDAANFQVVNVDATVMAQAPRLAPHISNMRAGLARSLGIPTSCVNVKATTTEGLGFVGRVEGMAAQAIATVLRRVAAG